MRIRAAVTGALTVVILVGCAPDPGPDTVEEPQPDETVEEAPPPPPDDVAGDLAQVTVNDLSRTESGLYPDGSGPDAPTPVDEAAVDASVAAAVAWVDAHLTDVQAGGPGRVGGVDLTADDVAVASELTNPDHPVTSVTYRATVGALGAPEWIRLSTEVRREDGQRTATFVFLPDGDGDVVLLAAQIGDGVPAPPAASPDEDDEATDGDDEATEEAP